MANKYVYILTNTATDNRGNVHSKSVMCFTSFAKATKAMASMTGKLNKLDTATVIRTGAIRVRIRHCNGFGSHLVIDRKLLH